MYQDILEDPEVQEIINKYDGNHQNDVPLDEFGKPLEFEGGEDLLDEEGNVKEVKEVKDDIKDDIKLNESSLDEFTDEIPEIDYTPQTDFSKNLDLTKIDDGFQKYVLTHLEPLELTDEEGNVVRAYTADDIPKDFKFTDQQAATKASTELARLQAQGDTLKQEFDDIIKNQETIATQNEMRIATREGLNEAIGNGEFPKLELDEKGNIDPNSKINQLADDIIAFQNETNKDRTPSRAISFDTALNRFKKENPDSFKDLDGSLAKEDKDRISFAKRTSQSSQRAGSNSSKGRYDNLSRAEFDELLNDPDFDVKQLL